MKKGVVIGIVSGVVVIGAGVAFFLISRKKKKQQEALAQQQAAMRTLQDATSSSNTSSTSSGISDEEVKKDGGYGWLLNNYKILQKYGAEIKDNFNASKKAFDDAVAKASKDEVAKRLGFDKNAVDWLRNIFLDTAAGKNKSVEDGIFAAIKYLKEKEKSSKKN
jgi:type II secretory pathway pseudopilin PulG